MCLLLCLVEFRHYDDFSNHFYSISLLFSFVICYQRKYHIYFFSFVYVVVVCFMFYIRLSKIRFKSITKTKKKQKNKKPLMQSKTLSNKTLYALNNKHFCCCCCFFLLLPNCLNKKQTYTQHNLKVFIFIFIFIFIFTT